MFEAGVGIADGSDEYAVGVKAASDAMAKLQEKQVDAKANVAIVFASSKYNHSTVLSGIESVVGPDTKIVGASTAGEITQAGPSIRESVVVMVLASDSVQFASTYSENIHTTSHEAGIHLAQEIKTALHEPQLITMFADGLRGNGSAIIRGILEVCGDNFPVVGGSAGDDGKFEKTFQFHGTDVRSNSVTGLGFAGPVDFSVGVNHGWSAVGAARTVTDSDGATVKTIDGKPAFELYKDYLGDEADNLKQYTLGEIALSYPLGILDEASGEVLLRAPFAVDDNGAIVCGGEVAVGSKVQLMMGTKEDAIVAAKKAATVAKAGFVGDHISAALIFSCHVRNTLFANSDAAKGEVDAISQVIGVDVPLIGFYTYAEQAPVGGTAHNIKNCNPEFHNETVVVVLLGETK